MTRAARDWCSNCPDREACATGATCSQVREQHLCRRDHVEQTPGYGRSIVRCVDCHRPGIRTFNPVHVTWEDELRPEPRKTHLASVWNGLWGPRCDNEAGWVVPLIPKDHGSVVDCERCLDWWAHDDA